MTYRVDSDIYYPYDTFIPCNGECQVDEYWTEKEVLENVRRKTKLVMQALSDCENHMFYLAFENSVCKDYITEKFWNLKHLIVPIVLSRRVFKQTKIPDNVYIAVDDFNNITELANYLLYLQRNKTEYLKYFDWTKTYRKTTYRLIYNKYDIIARQAYINSFNGTNAPSYNPLCNLCELAHKQHKNGHPRHIIRDIWKYWKSPYICIENWADIWLKGRHKEVYEKANWQ
uniref:Fucosyltransferase n=1 Tax=Meloidogyne hapla TaxID=6305 RepID=A0A1I8AZU0_MELHA